MKRYITKIIATQSFRYIAVGGSAFVAEYIIFALLMNLLLVPSVLVIAQTISFSCGLGISFFGNKFITFSDTTKTYKHSASSQFFKYATLAVTNLVLTNIFIYGAVNIYGIAPLFAKILVMFAVVSWNFLIFQKIIFKTE